jgi:hypothetical protein
MSAYLSLSAEPAFGARIPLSFVTDSSQEHPVSQTASDSQPRYTPPTDIASQDRASDSEAQLPIPSSQTVLLLHGLRQPYQITDGHPVPSTKHGHELLVRTDTIGLNPIDWKSP